MEEIITISKHAKKRIKQRLGLRGEMAENVVIKAFYNGLKLAEMKGHLKRWADKEVITHKSSIRILNQYAYFFRGTKLATVYHIPTHLRKLSDKLQKKKKYLI